MRKQAASIRSPLSQAGRTAPSDVAVLGDGLCSYDALASLAGRVAAVLRARKLKAGARILILGAPSVEYCAGLWGIFHASMIACPLNPAFPPQTLKNIVDLLQPGCLIHDDATEELGASSGVPRLAFSDIKDLEAGPEQEGGLRGDHPVSVILTSGSSGLPKAAVHTLGNHVFAARAANANLPLVPGDVWLLSLPLFHVSGLSLLFRCALAGATLALGRPGVAVVDDLERVGATHVSLVPTQLARLLASPAGRVVLQRMKGVLLGGAPMEKTLVERAVHAGVPLVRGYGMTETTAHLCATAPGASLHDLYSNGRPLVEGTLRISAAGEIEVNGPAVFAGYYQNGEIRRPGTADGWFRTGDLGYLDGAGRLFVTGRADAMFISGGENVHPEEIEAAILAMPGAQQVAVVDIPDAEYGARPAAFIRWSCATPPAADALTNTLLESLPRFKIPVVFLPWPEQASAGLKFDRAFFRAEARKHVR